MFRYFQHAQSQRYHNFADEPIEAQEIETVEVDEIDREERRSSFLARKSFALMNWLRGKPSQRADLAGSASDTDLIEVFDVLIKSQRRLQILGSDGIDILTKDDYKHSLLERDLVNRKAQQDPEQVYDLSEGLQPNQYDVEHPDYVQYHCLRFEIQRKSTAQQQPKLNVLKLTDVDFYLEGNRHAVL